MKFVTLATALLLVAFVPGVAQEGTITGRVIDADTRQPLRGATIVVQPAGAAKENVTRTKYGAYAGKTGAFSITDVPAGSYVVEARFVGYKKQTRKVSVVADETASAEFELVVDVKGVEEVVVTGVASRHTKAESEIAVARVNAAQLQEGNTYTEVSQLLSGKVTGVQIQQGSGNVGGGMRFTVRGGGGLNGNGMPVVFVDGVRINAGESAPTDVGGQGFSTLAQLNPQDIANIEVLKGPAGAALYGTAGSNGVVLITTKRGSGNQNFFRVNYQTIQGWNENPYTFDSTKIANAAGINNLFQQGAIAENNLSFTGQSGTVGYFASYSNRSEDGIVVQNGLRRESVRANFDLNPTGEISARVSGNYAWSTLRRPQGDNNILSIYANNLLVNPALFGGSPYIFGSDSLALSKIENTLSTNRIIASAEINYRPGWMAGLVLRAVIGYDGADNTNEAFQPPGFFYSGVQEEGIKTLVQTSSRRTNYDVNASYSSTLMENLESTTRVGAQLFDTKATSSDITMQNFASPRIRSISSAAQYISTDDGISQSREAGLYLQEELVYDGTYFLSLGLRQDYSTLLGTNALTRILPRASFAMRMDRMGFLPEIMNLAKLRFAYGSSGQLPGFLAADPLRWGASQSGYGVGYVVSAIGNPDITMESVNEFEVGLELEVDNRYGVDFTYYRGFATESIVNFPNPPSSGLTASAVPKNVGGINSWGFESNLYATLFRSEDYQLDLNVILNNQDNEVTDLGGAQPLGSTYGVQRIQVGYARAGFFDFAVKGAQFDDAGNYVGPVVSDSIEFLGRSIPTYTGSFGLTFRFLKHFTLYGFMEFATGASIYNLTRSFQVQFGNDVEFNNLQLALFGDGADIQPTLTPGTPEYVAAAEKFARLDPNFAGNYITAVDWFRFRELSLRVDATQWVRDLTGTTEIASLNLVFSARNVALFTDFFGADPEGNADGGQNAGVDRSVEFNTLMQPRTFTFQLNFGF